MVTTTDDIDFDFSQLDDTLISDTQKQNLVDYINQIKTQKRSINEEFNQFKTTTGIVNNIRLKLSIHFCQIILFIFLQ